MNQISFTVYAKPLPQGSMKYVGHRKGKPVLTSMTKRLKPFREEVAAAALREISNSNLQTPFATLHQPVELWLEFMFLKPESVKDRPWPSVRCGDIDKLQRSVLDGLSGVLYCDDSQVCLVSARKVYGGAEWVKVSARVISENSDS